MNKNEAIKKIEGTKGIFIIDNFLYMGETLRNDKDVALAAIRKNPKSFIYAGNDLKGDKEVVLEAVKRNGSLIEYASEDLKKDEDIILASKSKENEENINPDLLGYKELQSRLKMLKYQYDEIETKRENIINEVTEVLKQMTKMDSELSKMSITNENENQKTR